jgi:hypothetical protein
MLQPGKYDYILRVGYRQCFVALVAWLLLSGIVAAQDPSPTTSRLDLLLPAPTEASLKVTSPLVAGVKARNAALPDKIGV